MPHIITIHGPACAGKSTLCGMLRERLPTYPYVDRPYIKRGLKPAGKQEALRLSKETSYFLIQELLRGHYNIITEEINPESMKHNIGVELLTDYQIIPFFIWCSLETALQRDTHRKAKTVGEERMKEIHSNYAEPASYETLINTEKASMEACISQMLTYIEGRN